MPFNARKPPETPGNPPETPVLTLRKPLGNPRCILWAEAVNRAKLCTLPEVRRPVGARNPPETHRKPLCFTLREPRRTPRCFICPEAVNLRRSRYASGTYEGRRTSPCGARGVNGWTPPPNPHTALLKLWGSWEGPISHPGGRCGRLTGRVRRPVGARKPQETHWEGPIPHRGGRCGRLTGRACQCLRETWCWAPERASDVSGCRADLHWKHEEEPSPFLSVRKTAFTVTRVRPTGEGGRCSRSRPGLIRRPAQCEDDGVVRD